MSESKVMRVSKKEQDLIVLTRKIGMNNFLKALEREKNKEIPTVILDMFFKALKDNDIININEFFSNKDKDKTTIIEIIKKYLYENKTIIISGSIGSGKTTLLKTLFYMEDEEKEIVLLEDKYDGINSDKLTSNINKIEFDDLSYFLTAKESKTYIFDNIDEDILYKKLFVISCNQAVLTTVNYPKKFKTFKEYTDSVKEKSMLNINPNINNLDFLEIKLGDKLGYVKELITQNEIIKF